MKKIIKWFLVLMSMNVGLSSAQIDSEVIFRISSDVCIKAFSGKKAEQYFKQIADIRINLFNEYPYLYEGSYEVEREYLDIYFNASSSKILLVFDKDEVVGFSSAISLVDELSEIKQPFMIQQLPLSQYLYIGEVMLEPAYRGKGLLRHFFEYHESRAKQLGFKYLTFMTVARPENYPMKPKGYRPLEPIWEHFGYKKNDTLKIQLPWVQRDTHKVELNDLAVWIKAV